MTPTSASSKPRSRPLRTVVIVSVISLILLELLFRGAQCATDQTGHYRLHYHDRELFEPAPFNRWAMKENADFHQGGEHAVTNSLGWRSPEITRDKPQGTIRVMALGGSSVYGFGASENDTTWPARLELALEEHLGDVEVDVINAGVSGATTADAITRLAFLASEVQPDYAILYENVNDTLRNDPDPDVVFRHDYSHELGAWSEPWWSHSLFIYWARWRTLKVVGSGPERFDAPHPDGFDVYARNLRVFAAVAEAQGITPIFVNQAHRFAERGRPYGHLSADAAVEVMNTHGQLMTEVSAELDVLFIDAHALMAPHGADVFIDDVHLTDEGNALVAGFIADDLAAVIAGRATSEPSPQ